MRRLVPAPRGVTFVLWALLLSTVGCGEKIYQHRVIVHVVPGHPQLGPPPFAVALWNRSLGSDAAYAETWMRPTTPERPAVVQLTTTEPSRFLGSGSLPSVVGLALAVPRLNENGYYWLELKPEPAEETVISAPFVPWGSTEPDPRLPELKVQCVAERANGGWRLRLTVVP